MKITAIAITALFAFATPALADEALAMLISGANGSTVPDMIDLQQQASEFKQANDQQTQTLKSVGENGKKAAANAY